MDEESSMESDSESQLSNVAAFRGPQVPATRPRKDSAAKGNKRSVLTAISCILASISSKHTIFDKPMYYN